MPPNYSLPARPDRPPKKKKKKQPQYPPGTKVGVLQRKVKLPGGLTAWSPGRKPNVTGAGKSWKVGRAGAGKYKGWWIAKPIPKGQGKVTTPKGPKPPKPPTPPAPPLDPYGKYPDWAQAVLRSMDTDIAHTENYGKQVQQWLTGALAPIQAASQAATQNYRTSIAGLPQGSSVYVPQAGSMSPGGSTAGTPEAWKTDAAKAAASGYTQAMQGQGAVSSFLADTGMGNLRQQLETNFAQDLLRIPEAKKKEKMEYLSNLGQFLAEQESEALANKQEIALKSQNDWYDFIAQLTNAGVKLTDIQMDALPEPFKGTGGVLVQSQTQPTTPGYQWIQEGPNTWRGIKLPAAGGGKGAKPTGLIGPIDPGTPVPAGFVKVRSGGKIYWRTKPGAKGGGKGGVSQAERRQFFGDARDIWRGSVSTDPITGEKTTSAGVNKSGVEGYTDENGNALPGRSGAYVRVVRVQRLDNELMGYISSKKLRRQIIRSLVGSRQFNEWNSWASVQKNLQVAQRRGHI